MSGRLYSLLQRPREHSAPHVCVGGQMAIYRGHSRQENLILRATCVLRATVMFDHERIRTVMPLDLRQTPYARYLADQWQSDVRSKAAEALGFMSWEEVAERAAGLLGPPPWVMELIAWDPPRGLSGFRSAA